MDPYCLGEGTLRPAQRATFGSSIFPTVPEINTTFTTQNTLTASCEDYWRSHWAGVTYVTLEGVVEQCV